jgi:hypothetical protein
LRLKAKWFSCTLINVHAPTNKKTEQITEEFYNLLQQNINQIARSDIKIILGDFDAKVGKESIYKSTIGNEICSFLYCASFSLHLCSGWCTYT